MSIEIWKTLNNFSKYEISNLGNIKVKKTSLILKPTIKGGYCCVRIVNDDNIQVSMKVHRVIALCYILNPENKATVDHIDHDKENNKVSNLRWATITEQNNNKKKKEIYGLGVSRTVWRIDKETDEKIESYESIKSASKWVFDNNLTKVKDFNNGDNIKTTISAVAQGKNKTSYGYKWKYDDKNDNKYKDEIWKNIPENLINETKEYKISNYGRIKSPINRITEGHNNKNGYLDFKISNKGYNLHRLVAKVFIENLDNKEQVNHIDGNKKNNHINNLEWCTNQENQIHKVKSGLSGTTRKIIQYDLNMKKIKQFDSQKEAANELNVCYASISKVCRAAQKSTGGFIFKYLEA
jgi:hypothetical protein